MSADPGSDATAAPQPRTPAVSPDVPPASPPAAGPAHPPDSRHVVPTGANGLAPARTIASDATALLHTFAAALERGDAEAAAACFAPDAIYEEPPRFRFEGQDAIAAFIRDFAARHSGVRFEIVRMLANPDSTLLAAEWRFAHTRTSDGAHASYAGMSFVALAGGRITHWRGYSVASQ